MQIETEKVTFALEVDGNIILEFEDGTSTMIPEGPIESKERTIAKQWIQDNPAKIKLYLCKLELKNIKKQLKSMVVSVEHLMRGL